MLRHTCGFALANKGHDTRALPAYLAGTSAELVDGSEIFFGEFDGAVVCLILIRLSLRRT
jgi:hypothetical protein